MHNKFFYIFRKDLNEQKTKRWYWYTCIAAILILFFISQKGIQKFHLAQKNVEIFRLNVNEVRKLHSSYSKYGDTGIHLLKTLSHASIFFPSHTILGHFDTGPAFTLYQDLKKDGMLTDFKGFIGLFTYFILFASIFLGIRAFKNRELTHYYRSIKEVKKNTALWAISLSRITLVSLLLWLVYLLVYLQCLFQRISLEILPLVSYGLLLELTVLSYLFLGVFLDIYFPKFKTAIAILYFFLSLVILPGAINEFVHSENDSFQVALNNLEQLTEFQNNFSKNFGKISKGEPVSDQMKGILDMGRKLVYGTMKNNEKNIYSDMKKQIKLKHLLHSFLPSSFIISCSRELSGGWDKGLLAFFQFTQKTKDDFVKFIIQKKYYEKSEKGKVAPFPGPQVFYSKPAFPFYTTFGIFMTIIWNLFLIVISRNGFMHRLEKIHDKYKTEKIIIKKNIENYFFTKSKEVKSAILKMLLSKDKNIIIEGHLNQPLDFVYLPDPRYLPHDAEKLLGSEPDPGQPRWVSLLKAAFKANKTVIANWKLQQLGKTGRIRLREIIKEGVFLNLGDDIVSYWLSENKLKWENDDSIEEHDVKLLAARLSQLNPN